MKTKFKEEAIPGYRVAYVRQVGPYGPRNREAMEKLKKWAMEKELLTDSAIILGIAQDDPVVTQPENCRYDACIVISEDYPLNDSIGESVIPHGKYVICTIQHTEEEVQKAWAEVIPYLQNSGYQIDNRPIMERYTGEMIKNDLCEICIPVRDV